MEEISYLILIMTVFAEALIYIAGRWVQSNELA